MQFRPVRFWSKFITRVRSCCLCLQVATAALAAVAAHVQDSGIALQLVQRVCGVLDGTAEGKIKAAAERAALAAALGALAHVPAGQPGMEEVAAAAATSCSILYSDERKQEVWGGGALRVVAQQLARLRCVLVCVLQTCVYYIEPPNKCSQGHYFVCCCAAVEEVKIALMSCLARWLPCCGLSGCSAAVSAQLAAGLGDAKDSLRKACLCAALAATRAVPGMAAQLTPVAAPAAKLVAEGGAKAVSRGIGVSALLVGAQVAAANPEAGVWC